ncbi:MAG: hypothetical protein ACXWAV_04055, partial [Chthoniobacterales bacterium]
MQFLWRLACSTSLLLLATLVVGSAQTSPPPLPPISTTPTPAPTATPESEGAKPTPSSAVENSVVKIFSSIRAPDLTKPWAKQAAAEVTGSGVVIEGKRILTNAHVVAFSSQVQIQANQAGDKLAANVEA